MKIGPLAVFTNFSDDWLLSRQATRLFLLAVVFTALVTLVLLGLIDTSKMVPRERFVADVFGAVGSLSALFIWAGMWRYWYRIDDSSAWSKRFWFFVLLLGLPWGSCVYFLLVYLPRATRYNRANA